MDHLFYLCHVFVMLSRLFIAALWPRAGKELTYWLSFVMFICVLQLFFGFVQQCHRVIHSTESVILLTVAQKGMN